MIGWPEHVADISAVRLRELARRHADPFRVEYSLHCIQYVAGVFCSGDAGHRPILVYCGDDLRDLGFHGLFGVLDLFDSLIAFGSQIGQVLPEARHTVVGSAVCPLFDAVLFGYRPRLLFTLSEGIA
ncbi:hypothetical protein AWC05_12115 [Mycobacterium florentinum]|uniref:Uncharacterized protein n=1 Tax=Mycobacterium florentinum TaxID=292462 RepID=A0A1X1UGG1_MYCFL|nr:hypothetical protein [Mycobacterium florentinum]MCV7412953.1 hypothetical protein [Mycobacterium florentinum]ORV55910.1 hypothetical protein AWC05_12115 [Mycobacterium florentinum]